MSKAFHEPFFIQLPVHGPWACPVLVLVAFPDRPAAVSEFFFKCRLRGICRMFCSWGPVFFFASPWLQGFPQPRLMPLSLHKRQTARRRSDGQTVGRSDGQTVGRSDGRVVSCLDGSDGRAVKASEAFLETHHAGTGAGLRPPNPPVVLIRASLFPST